MAVTTKRLAGEFIDWKLRTQKFHGRLIILERIYLFGYESDVVAINWETDSVVDYELKISAGDYRNEKQKLEKASKFSAAESENMPNHSFLVIPKEVYEKWGDDGHDRQGIIVFSEDEWNRRIRFEMVRQSETFTEKKFDGYKEVLRKKYAR